MLVLGTFAVILAILAVPAPQVVSLPVAAGGGGLQLVDQLVISAMIAWLLNLVKRAEAIPWITHETERLNTITAVIVSGLAAAGIHFRFEGEAGVLTISGLTLAGIIHALWEWAKAYILQEYVSKTAFRSRADSPAGATSPAAARAAAG
jgi:hypothetical protein